MASIAELYLERARRAGDTKRREGEISANLASQLAGIAGNTLTTIARDRAEAPARQQEQRMRDLQLDQAETAALDQSRAKSRAEAMDAVLRGSRMTDPSTGVSTYDRAKLQAGMAEAGVPETELARYLPILDAADQSIASVKKAQQEALTHSAMLVDMAGNDPLIFRHELERGIENGLFTQEQAAPFLEIATSQPDRIATITAGLLGKEAPKPITLNPGDVAVDPATGKSIASNPKPTEPPKQYEVVVKGPNGRPVKKLVSEAEMRGGVEQYVEPKDSNEPLVAVLGPDGQSVYVPRSQAVGKRPANAREQGRPVISGDANKLADFDTSLNDLKVLNRAITETDAATGTAAALGAGAPAWVTDLTGWGVDAKKRQGVIDRVKQVIGKTLEGGVLRKEDEYKYEKILPTIKDTPAVAQAKLAGLEAAIAQRKQTTMDSLDDAGYDVSRYRARQPAQPARQDPLGIR